MDSTAVTEKIKRTAQSTDQLIQKLDSMTARIDAAREAGNIDLVKYYEDQFTQISIEFMDGVETMIDGWYELRGETRPAPEDEMLSLETLEDIHSIVVDILQGIPVDLTKHPAPQPTPITAEIAGPEPTPTPMHRPDSTPKHRVDITG